MSSFNAVKQAVCQILKDDGKTHIGTGFFFLPDGYLLTCHHVIFGMKKLLVNIPSKQASYEAEYLKEFSNPIADFAILKISGVSPPAIQLGRLREDCEAYGYGFRPRTMSFEPKGHTFSGRLGPGQKLQIPISDRLKAQLEQIPLNQRQPWNILPEEFRVGDVKTFNCIGGLEHGVSGMPIFDRQLNRVVGFFRALEGDTNSNIGYIIPMNDVFAHWKDLEEDNRYLVPDEPLDRLKREYEIRLEAEGGKIISPILRRQFEPIISNHKIFGRQKELALLNRFIDLKESGYFLILGPAGFGKTALLANWTQSLESNMVSTIIHFITPPFIDAGKNFCLRNLCEQLLALHKLGGNLPQDENHLQSLYSDLLKLSPPPESRIVLIIDGLDEAMGWKPGSNIFPQSLPEGVFVVISMRSGYYEEVEFLKEWTANSNILNLQNLHRDEIIDWLQFAQDGKLKVFADDKNFVTKLVEKTEGFPLYLKFLIEEIYHAVENDGKDMKNIIEQIPQGFSKYIHKQFNQLALMEDVKNNRKVQELFHWSSLKTTIPL